MTAGGTDFVRRVDEITARIRDVDAALASQIRAEASDDVAHWQRGDYRATLIYHRAADPPRLELEMLHGEDEHPEAMLIGFDDPDAVELIAEPVAAFLAGRPEG